MYVEYAYGKQLQLLEIDNKLNEQFYMDRIHIAYITVVHPIGMRTAAGEYDFYKQTKQQKISMYDLVYTTHILYYMI